MTLKLTAAVLQARSPHPARRAPTRTRHLPWWAAALLASACTPMPLDREDGSQTSAEPAPAEQTQTTSAAPADSGPVSWQDGNEYWVYADPNNIPVIAPQNWLFEEEAITLTLSAEPVLNVFDGRIHTTVVQLFQLRDPRAFKDMTKNPAGLQYLLSSKAEALGQDVVDYREAIVTPGGELTLKVDRQEGTKFLAIIVGFFDLERGRITRLISFPAIDDTPPIRYGLFDALTFGLFADEPAPIPPRPARLHITMKLGANDISAVTIKAH